MPKVSVLQEVLGAEKEKQPTTREAPASCRLCCCATACCRFLLTHFPLTPPHTTGTTQHREPLHRYVVVERLWDGCLCLWFLSVCFPLAPKPPPSPS